MVQPFILITDENKKQITYDPKHKHAFVCPVTGASFKTRVKFWKYIKESKLKPKDLDLEIKPNISEENEEHTEQLFHTEDLESLWNSYFNQAYNERKLEDIVGLIDLELYKTLIKISKGDEDVDECINEKYQDLVEKNDIEEINKILVSSNMDNQQELMNNVIVLINHKGLQYIATELNIANGTVQRWVDTKKVPKSYQFDIKKLCNGDIDYTKFTYKEKDQFFTPANISEYSIKTFKKIMKENNIDINEYTFIEPSAGDGSFTKLLPENTISFDIEPRYEKIIKQDYLKWMPQITGKYITIGNPPFGLRGNLALRFINHSVKFSDHLCFLLPPLFESDGRGAPMKRVDGYNLIHSEKIDTNFYDPDGKEIKVNVILQIWSKHINNDKYKIKSNDNKLFKVYSLSDGGTPGSTRNKNMLNECDIYIPSTCFMGFN